MARTPESPDAPRPGLPPEDRRSADPSPAPPPVRTDPALDEHQKRGVSGAMWTALLLGLLILVLLLVFILQNNVPTDFRFLGWEFVLPLGIAMLFAAVAGALVMGLVGSVRLFRLSHRVRRLEKERTDIKRALG
ncbi:lipopolysaccharide assembly LapA domain-containing protein [Kocuria sp. CNJ-770]|uniref:LapA family protein n=1 Tax=Kocuria sp. CNJ-770 TaxID=1904964 RepID=UPI00096A3ABA|nr:LapA family protein [Kocuria sp. CNJ-770]